MSENSDAIVIVVSEETGQISVAINGVLTRDYTHDKLKALLEEEIFNDKTEISIGKKKLFSSRSERRKKE
jgi:diadenylate cyclase